MDLNNEAYDFAHYFTNPAPSLPDAGFTIAFYKEGEDTAPFHTEYVYASQKNIWQYQDRTTTPYTNIGEMSLIDSTGKSIYIPRYDYRKNNPQNKK